MTNVYEHEKRIAHLEEQISELSERIEILEGVVYGGAEPPPQIDPDAEPLEGLEPTEPTEPTEPARFDPNVHTVAEVKEYLESLDPEVDGDVIQAILALELAGKARVGILGD